MKERLEDVLQMKAVSFVDDAPWVTQDALVGSVIKLVNESPDHVAHVVDERKKLVGIITQQDVLAALEKPKLAAKISEQTAIAKELMNPIDALNAPTVSLTTDTLQDIVDKLKSEQVRVMPVVNQMGQPIGQVSKRSISRNLDIVLK